MYVQYILMLTRGLYGAYGGACRARGGKNNEYLCMTIFQCELAIVLSQVPLKRERAELHTDTKNKTKRAEITDTEIIQFSTAFG